MEMKRKRQPIRAAAVIRGSAAYPNINGKIIFIQQNSGVLVTAEIYGLPNGEQCKPGIFALHIHEGTDCSGNDKDPFANALGHFNPGGCEHPYHAGDLPPLFGNNGYAYMSVFTNRFAIRDIINRTVIIHEKADDFTSQPAGNAGKKIACGKIKLVQ